MPYVHTGKGVVRWTCESRQAMAWALMFDACDGAEEQIRERKTVGPALGVMKGFGLEV